jgi:putative glutathione S-transferase
VRELKGLQEYIGERSCCSCLRSEDLTIVDVSTVHPHMLEGGWHFVKPENASKSPAPPAEHSFDTFPAATADKLHGSAYLRDLYFRAEPDYNARFTVPVLWDTQNNTIVNNESSEVIRDLNSSFNSILPDGAGKELDLYPKELRKEIDKLNEWVYNDINNGVYKSGFATSQEAYEKAVIPVFDSLDRLEEILGDGREYLIGGRLTEADVR